AGMQVPEDAIDQRTVVLPRMAGTTLVVAVREERCDPFPLFVGKIKAVHGWPPSGNLPSREWALPTYKSATPIPGILRNDLDLSLRNSFPPGEAWSVLSRPDKVARWPTQLPGGSEGQWLSLAAYRCPRRGSGQLANSAPRVSLTDM